MASRKVDDTDQSYEIGRFVSIMRQMEDELQATSKEFNPGDVDKSIPYFIECPEKAMDDCQIHLIQAQKRIKEMGRYELLEHIREVFELIDMPFLSEIVLHEEEFMRGFRSQHQVYFF